MELACGGAQDDEDYPKNTSLVRIFPELDQLIDKADALAKDGRFLDTLKIYAACEKRPNHLVPADGSAASASRYVGVFEYCRRKIGAWPPEGRAAYRAFMDAAAGQAFHAARATRDADALSAQALRYPFSSFTDDALALLGNLHAEAGRFGPAAEAYERLLEFPDSDIPRPLVVARLGGAYAGAGRREHLADLITRAEREMPAATISWGDGSIRVTELLNEQLRTAAEPHREAAATLFSRWEMMQGHPSGVRLAEPARIGAHAWSAAIPPTPFEEEEDHWGRDLPMRNEMSSLPVLPAVSDGIVYFHTDYHAFAYNLYANAPQLLWSFRKDVPPGSLMQEERLVHAASVAEGRVYVNLITALGRHEIQMSYIPVKFPFPKRALFCLDAYTGREQWRLGGVMRSDEFEEGLSFATPPTPYEGLLYVGAMRQKYSTDPFEHYVLCVEPETGRVRWSTFVASGGTEINLFGNSTRESLGSPVAVDGDSAYYATNHGAVAALDRASGRIRWLVKYPQLPVRPTRNVSVRRNPLEWLSCAPVVLQGAVVFAPTDSRHLLAFDAHTGVKLWERTRGDARAIAGSDGTRLILSGTALEWIDVAKGGREIARFEPPRGVAVGRAAVAADGAYLPTTAGLYRVTLEAEGPPRAHLTEWPGGRRQGGNVVSAEGAIVLAGAKLVEVFLQRRETERSAEDELARHPDDPAAAYRAALLFLQAGRSDRASELFRRVIEMTASSSAPERTRLARAARKRLFASAMDEGRRALEARRPDAARQAFRAARDAAPDVSSIVEATVQLARLHAAQGRNEAAIGEYQFLIQNHGGEAVGGQRAFDFARSAIAAMIATSGREPYGAFERAAEARLERASDNPSPEALMDVYRAYPNSDAAERAVLKAADTFIRLGRPDAAAGALRLFLREFPASDRALEAQAELVRALERSSQFTGAAAVLRKMAREGDERELNEGGRKITVREFAESRFQRKEYAPALAPSPPVALKTPLTKVSTYVEQEFGAGGEILRPEGPPLARGKGLLFMSTPGAVKAIDPKTGAVAWRMPTDVPVRAAYSVEEALLLCSDTAIVRVNPETGAVEWRHTPALPMKGFRRAGSMMCYLAPDPNVGTAATVVALDTARGTPSWTQTYEGMALPVIHTLDDLLCIVTVAPNRIHRFETETGRRSESIPIYSQGSALRILGMVDGVMVLRTNGNLLEAYDVAAGSLTWRSSILVEHVSALNLTRAGLFVAGMGKRGPCAMLHDMEHGKLKAVTIAEWPQESVLEGSTAADGTRFILGTRRDDGRVTMRSLDPASDVLKERWAYSFEKPVLQAVSALASEQVVAFSVSRAKDGRFDFSATLLDPQGRPVQNIFSEAPSERPAAFTVVGESLLLFIGNRVEIYQ
ncbi:MAG: PQQ-binding-like beta-propeller repeat protein [Planctomycetes bacterium]|nr:PQQ-binding-like beta-propeller repeat protein [Planctomycetota bacterium]